MSVENDTDSVSSVRESEDLGHDVEGLNVSPDSSACGCGDSDLDPQVSHAPLSSSSSENGPVYDSEGDNCSAPSSACDCDEPGHEPKVIEDQIPMPSKEGWDDLNLELEVLDILIIGAGPCGLAAAARIREQTPAAMFTDDEHRRWHRLNKYGHKLALKDSKTGNVIPAQRDPVPEYSMAVLDETDDKWMGFWRDRFATFDISHLRSPMIWHVDPQDRDSLLRHVEREGTEKDKIEIKNCVGKEMSKNKRKAAKFCGSSKSSRVDINQRDSNDYHRPSNAIFLDHCDWVARRYQLHGPGVVLKETVRDMLYGPWDEIPAANNVFKIITDKSIRYARTVILAVGPANKAVLPQIRSLSYPGQSEDMVMPQACHSINIRRNHFPDPVVQQRISDRRTTSMLIVGGGLTSFQLADLAIRSGVTRVWQILRSRLKQKIFDVDLDWIAKFKTKNLEAFHTWDLPRDKMNMFLAARDGGSTTPAFHRETTKPYMKADKLRMFTNTLLTEAHFEDLPDREGGVWKVKTEPPLDNPPASFDYICFATGCQSDFTKLPYLQNMLQDYPIENERGFPVLNQDLMWSDDVPLFVAGRLAGLKLGPAAPNLGGARDGAERIALAVDEVLSWSGSGPKPGHFASEWETVKEGERDRETDRFNYATGIGSQFSVLPEISE